MRRKLLRVPLVGALTVVALCFPGLGTAHVAIGATDITCQQITPDVPGNLIVPAGSSCSVKNITVQGNVVVEQGAFFEMTNSTVVGDVLSSGARVVRIRTDQIRGTWS